MQMARIALKILIKMYKEYRVHVNHWNSLHVVCTLKEFCTQCTPTEWGLHTVEIYNAEEEIIIGTLGAPTSV